MEKQKYGWFWDCPNGPTCIYRHALPPGFVLKKDQKKEANKENETSLEDWIETERQKLISEKTDLTKVTMETFVAWKRRKLEERKEEKRKMEEKKLKEFKAGGRSGVSEDLLIVAMTTETVAMTTFIISPALRPRHVHLQPGTSPR